MQQSRLAHTGRAPLFRAREDVEGPMKVCIRDRSINCHEEWHRLRAFGTRHDPVSCGDGIVRPRVSGQDLSMRSAVCASCVV
jgi:hypothetical protein